MCDFGYIFAEKRKELGLSQTEVAERLHVTKQAVSKWETGKGLPDTGTLPQIAEMFDMTVDELITGRAVKQNSDENAKVNKPDKKHNPKRKMWAIIVPILVAVIVVSASLMGVYIPKAVKPDTPPIQDNPTPPPPAQENGYYREIYVVKSTDTDISDISGSRRAYSAPLSDMKAHYVFKPQFNSDYEIKIQAAKNAKVYINDELFAVYGENGEEFEAKTYAAYMCKGEEYKILIDMSLCSGQNQWQNNQKINYVKQKVGYDNVTVRANSEYAFVVARYDEYRVQRLFLNNSDLKFKSFCRARRYETINETNQYGEQVKLNWANVIYWKDDNPALFDLGEGRSDIEFLLEMETDAFIFNGDYVCVIKNNTENDVALSISESDAEEIQLGQKISVHADEFMPKYYKINWTGNNPYLFCYFTSNDGSVFRSPLSLISLNGDFFVTETSGWGDNWSSYKSRIGCTSFYLKSSYLDTLDYDFLITNEQINNPMDYLM